MLSKRLIGIFMLAGPILAIIMILLEQTYGRGGGSSFGEQLKAMSDNYTLATIGSIGFSIAILAIFIGFHSLARSMQGEGKSGSDLAGLASLFAILIAGIYFVSLGIELIATERESDWIKSGGDAINAFTLSEAISRSIFVFDGLVMLFLGLAILRQKNFNQIVGGLFTFFGVCVLFGGMLSAGDNWAGMIWFIGFLGFPIITAVTGFLILRQVRKNT
jgi:hypothetical protein